jgi:hypothetical protein
MSNSWKTIEIHKNRNSLRNKIYILQERFPKAKSTHFLFSKERQTGIL